VSLTVAHPRHQFATFVVDVVSDPHGGATATWRVFPWDAAARRHASLPPRAVRLDGSGWLQVQQLVLDPRFTALPPVEAGSGFDGATWTLESCVANRYRFVQRREPKAADKDDFLRVARSLVQLTGAACTLPGDRKVSSEGGPPC
jgi:hypothetical protein